MDENPFIPALEVEPVAEEQQERSFAFYAEAFFWVLGLGAIAAWLIALILVTFGVVGG